MLGLKHTYSKPTISISWKLADIYHFFGQGCFPFSPHFTTTHSFKVMLQIKLSQNFLNLYSNIPSFLIIQDTILVSIVVRIPACHAGDRGSIPRRGVYFEEFKNQGK